MSVIRLRLGALLMGLWLCTLLAACSAFTPEEPPVADTTLTEVLMELHLADVRARVLRDTSLAALHDSIFAHYGMTRAQFERALDYYAQHPQRLAAVYDAVVDSLSSRRLRMRGGRP